MTSRQITLIVLLTLALTACGTQSTPAPQPTTEPTEETVTQEATAEVTPELSELALEGKAVFERFYDEVSFACVTCHYASSDNRLLGPGLLSIEERFEDYDTEEDDLEAYIRASILNPRDFIVPDDSPYPENIMPTTYEDILSDDDLDALVAYILSY